MSDLVLKINNLEKWFGNNKVFEDACLEVRSGEVVSIIGSSGSDKTTLLRCVNLLEPFQKGSIIIDGKEVGYHEVKIEAEKLRIKWLKRVHNLS